MTQGQLYIRIFLGSPLKVDYTSIYVQLDLVGMWVNAALAMPTDPLVKEQNYFLLTDCAATDTFL